MLLFLPSILFPPTRACVAKSLETFIRGYIVCWYNAARPWHQLLRAVDSASFPIEFGRPPFYNIHGRCSVYNRKESTPCCCYDGHNQLATLLDASFRLHFQKNCLNTF